MDALGINVFSLVVYSLLFLIVYLLLDKYLLPGLRRNIKARQELIAANVAKVKELEEETARQQTQLSATEKEVLTVAKSRQEEIVAAAETEAREIISKAKQKAQGILADSKTAIQHKQQALEAEFEHKLNERLGQVFTYLNQEQKLAIDTASLKKAVEATKN